MFATGSPEGATSSRIFLFQPKQDLKHLGAPTPKFSSTATARIAPRLPPPSPFIGVLGACNLPGDLVDWPLLLFLFLLPLPLLLRLLPALALASSSSPGAQTSQSASPAARRATGLLSAPRSRLLLAAAWGHGRGQRTPEGPAPRAQRALEPDVETSCALIELRREPSVFGVRLREPAGRPRSPSATRLHAPPTR